ncbi:MAG: S46 family peptidase, partial [Bacteroidales bacterium]|nr:S46 family peptidase [Bacteroidales bacterium]
LENEYEGNIANWTDAIFSNTIFNKKDSLLSFVENYSLENKSDILNDPIYAIMESILNSYTEKIDLKSGYLHTKKDSLDRIWMQALMDFEPKKNFYPDANSTLRVSYGKVSSSYPRNGIKYLYQTTLDGIMEKDNPDVYDYRVPEKLKELYKAKDYGKWGADGRMPVAFIATNHTTGGNSGSPVLNAYGQLIGVNFDRSWESTMSDIMFDPEQCRNISLDIRFALFIMEKYFGADRLINEINFAKE